MELQFEELEAAATEDELAAEGAATKTTYVTGFTRKRPARRPFPEHLPRECIVAPAPAACACCGGTRLSKPGRLDRLAGCWATSCGIAPGAALACAAWVALMDHVGGFGRSAFAEAASREELLAVKALEALAGRAGT